MLVANTVIDDADCQVKTTGIRFEEIPVAKASLGLQAGAEVASVERDAADFVASS